MRDERRIPRVVSLLHEIWLLVPDWRLGQILVNAHKGFETNPFYYEDDALESNLQELLERIKDTSHRSTA